MRSRRSSYSGYYRQCRGGIAAVLILLFAVSCKTPGNKDMELYVNETFTLNKAVEENNKADDSGLKDFSDAEFPGVYKLAGDPICSMSLVIKRDAEGYSYSLSGGVLTSSGRIGSEIKGGQIYIYLRGTICSGSNAVASGVYSNKTIIMQNYDFSTNRFACFRECDSKNLRFVKTE